VVIKELYVEGKGRKIHPKEGEAEEGGEGGGEKRKGERADLEKDFTDVSVSRETRGGGCAEGPEVC